MALDPISSGIDLITSIISRVWPDKSEEEKAKLALALAEDNNLTALLSKQLDVDDTEASSPNLFVAGWRPFVGWICACSFAWQFVILPILLFIGNAVGHPIPVPAFDFNSMTTVLMGMLGMGGLRTYEKLKGVTK